MPTEPRLDRLPDDLVRRLKRALPTRARSAFVHQLLEKALLVEDEGVLYLAALAVEQDTALSAEMAAWEKAAIGDGLDDLPSFQRRPQGV